MSRLALAFISAQSIISLGDLSLSSVTSRPRISLEQRVPPCDRAEHHRWKAKYAGLEVNEARWLRTLEHENTRLKRLVVDLTLDNQALKEVVGKRSDAPRRIAVRRSRPSSS